MTRMFREVMKTWSPIIGCLGHQCTYCYARALAEGRLKGTPKYAEGFKPRLWEPALKSRFHQGLVFVCNMGDLWGEWVPAEWIGRVLGVARQSPKATFLFLTKNPARYFEHLDDMPPNVILGATIETDHYPTQGISLAPAPERRAHVLAGLGDKWPTMVSIEPVLDFDLDTLVAMVKSIAPQFVYLGMDNWNHHLPEPPLAKTRELIAALGEFTEVRVKTLRKAWDEKATGQPAERRRDESGLLDRTIGWDSI